MKNNTLLLIGAAALFFYLWKKKQPAKIPEVLTSQALPPNIEEVKSQTVNFQQLAPTPATVMDLPGTPPAYSAGACSCNQGSKLSGLPFVC